MQLFVKMKTIFSYTEEFNKLINNFIFQFLNIILQLLHIILVVYWLLFHIIYSLLLYNHWILLSLFYSYSGCSVNILTSCSCRLWNYTSDLARCNPHAEATQGPQVRKSFFVCAKRLSTALQAQLLSIFPLPLSFSSFSLSLPSYQSVPVVIPTASLPKNRRTQPDNFEIPSAV